MAGRDSSGGVQGDYPGGHPRLHLFYRARPGRKIVGTVQLRHTLNDDLRQCDRHIGYGIRPDERGQGYGTVQLTLTLEKAKERNIPWVMITCDRSNTASAAVARRNGAILIRESYDKEDGYIRVFRVELQHEFRFY